VLTPVGLTPFTKLPIALSRLIAAPVLSVIVIAAQAGPHTGASPCKITEPFGSYGIVLGATAIPPAPSTEAPADAFAPANYGEIKTTGKLKIFPST
jgi:hypothetical protein